MTDAKMTVYDFGGDVLLQNDDFAEEKGLFTAVLISLFSDARAPDDSELPQFEVGRRGWWDNRKNAQHHVGSLLWLIGRETTAEVRRVPARAEEAAQKSLEWMIDLGIASVVDVQASIQANMALQLLIDITRGDSLEYQYLWDGVAESEQIQFGNTSVQLKFNR